ncbi:hypothetical protein LguiB_026057 [Lonicera macranthoides]
MHDMEEGVRYAAPSGGVIKKKSSSGCLIIKKKGDGIGDSISKKVFDSRKEKKRPRLVLSDSESSGKLLEPIRSKFVCESDEFRNGSVSYRKGFVEEDGFIKNGLVESERKRSAIDFDEYDGFNGKKMRKDYVDNRLKLAGPSGSRRETGSYMVDKIKHSYFNGTGSNVPNYKNRHEVDEDETHLPVTLLKEMYQEVPNEPIRLQGKNGVLKVMVNKNKQFGLYHKSYDHQKAQDRKGFRSEEAVKNVANVANQPSFYPASKCPEKRPPFVGTEKSELNSQGHEKLVPFARTDKSDLKLPKKPNKSSRAGDSETDDSEASLKLRSSSMQACNSRKTIKSEEKATPATEIVTPVKGKEAKVKRGTGTEKQILREKIRSMLLKAGWTIDYRPRRNRDYLDAVYVNPAGTAYWSIIKAYDALQKQLEEKNIDTLLPEETLSKLTRQTRKKIEREMNKKRRDEGGIKNPKDASVKDTEGKLSLHKKQNHASGDDLQGNLDKQGSEEEKAEKQFSRTNSHLVQGRKSRKIGRCTLLVRTSDNELNSENDGFVPYTGKRTLLYWLIDSGIVHMGEKVQYMNRKKTRVMLEGWITTDGIHCCCCSKILPISKFEIHAGSKQRQPFQHVFLESGSSLVQCLVDAWNRQEESERQSHHTIDIDGDDPNDDTCGLCADGGDLICCDGCPSTFHQSCLNIQMLPPGDWHCTNCRCKFCGIGGGSITEENSRTVSALRICGHCEKKYHKSCSKEMDDIPVDSKNATAFCGVRCRELFGHLQKLLGVKHELEAGFSWSLIRQMDPFSDLSQAEFAQRVECNSKLAVALTVMDECFLPIRDRRSGINIIHNVLYNCGSNFSRLNYNGFYTAILERGDEIISAASIRIHGTELAEMPFIGTRHIYRRQGMCRRLLSAIESVLCSFKVEKLMIPAIAEHMRTWTEVFNFKPLEEIYKQEIRSINMLVFPGIDVLQKKLLVKQEIPEGNKTGNSEEPELDCSVGHGGPSDDAKGEHLNEINDIAADTSSGFQFHSKETISTNFQLEEESENKNSVSVPIVNETDEKSTVLLNLDVAIHGNCNPVSASTISSSDEGILQINANSNHQIEVESRLPISSKVVFDEVAAPADTKIACVEPVLDSLGETVQNEEPMDSSCGSD